MFQIVKRHFSRYTPEMVEQVTGCPQETFLEVAETLLANSGPERTAVVRLRRRLDPAHLRRADDRRCALLQLLLGNIGRPGGGIMALRGHATIQGSHRHPDALPLHPRLHAAPDRAQDARHARATT